MFLMIKHLVEFYNPGHPHVNEDGMVEMPMLMCLEKWLI